LDLIRGWIISSDGLEKIADYLVVGQLATRKVHVGLRRAMASSSGSITTSRSGAPN
jgi:hypothetical protein